MVCKTHPVHSRELPVRVHCQRGRRQLLAMTRQKSKPWAQTEQTHPSTWLVDQWKQRGLLASDASVTFADIEALQAGSWFVRRNRRTPKASDDLEAPQTGSWFLRRNRSTPKASEQVFKRPLRDRSNSIVALIEARLLTPPSCTPSTRSFLATSLKAEADCSVRLNIYDLCPCWNSLAHHVGIGVYHSALELGGVEYSFDNHRPDHRNQTKGLIWHQPYHEDTSLRTSMPLRMRILLGRSSSSLDASHELLRSMSSEWPATNYDLLECNCHHWCDTAASALGVRRVPNWVTRSVSVLLFFSGGDSSQSPHSPAPERRWGLDIFEQQGGARGSHEREPLLKSVPTSFGNARGCKSLRESPQRVKGREAMRNICNM